MFCVHCSSPLFCHPFNSVSRFFFYSSKWTGYERLKGELMATRKLLNCICSSPFYKIVRLLHLLHTYIFFALLWGKIFSFEKQEKNKANDG